jgi:hypothetical protein
MDNQKEKMSLNLVIDDQTIVKYLMQFDESERAEKALEAMRIGVIAIQSASPSLDTKVVEEKFREIEKDLKDYTDEFKISIETEMKKYFEKDKGDVHLVLNSFFGDRGAFSATLKEYFDSEGGKVSLLIKDKIGPGSSFAKAVDPADKASVISRIEEVVNKKMSESVDGLIEQFSLDKNDSGMSRIKKVVEDKINEIKTSNDAFFHELREHLNMRKARAEEAEKGTQKGRDFETILYEKIAKLGTQLQDVTENVTGIPGAIPRVKVGDYVATLGDTSGAPKKRIVIEAKKGKKYTLLDAVEELKQAKENRLADCGIFVFAKGYEPIEIGDFRIIENDFFCTADETMLEQDVPLLFVEAAYRISRVFIVSQVRKEKCGEIDLAAIKGKIEKMKGCVDLMSDLITKAKTIQKSGENIEETTVKIKEELDSIIQATLETLK